MTNPVNPNPINSLDALVQAANQAATELGKANSGNAILDKATKSLKQGLATLTKVRADAKAEGALADQLSESLKGSYDGQASDIVRRIRMNVKTEIGLRVTAVCEAEKALISAKKGAADAKAALDASNVPFDDAQKKLLALPKEIQDQQKLLVALRAELTDAHSKHQLIEAVVKLADLQTAVTDLNAMIAPEHETELWSDLNSAVKDLIQKAEALVEAQATVTEMEGKFNQAKAARDDAQKDRLDRIKKLVADEDGVSSAVTL